jgi:4-hydroxy-tetrahydrodipicolinate reductase
MIKTAVWGPGSMGLIALRAVIDHPALELSGVVVHSDRKDGRDAGWLCGIDDVGIVATRAPAAVLTGDTEVVVYAAAANTRPAEAIEDMAAILRAGKDVVSCSVVPLVFPAVVDDALAGPLRNACVQGGVSFFNTGIAPGFAMDVLPLTVSGLSRSIESVRITEIFNYGTYPDPTAVYEVLGFGKPPEYQAFAATPGVLSFGWGPVLHQLAAGLGVRIDDLTEHIERRVTDQGFDTPTGRVEAGTVGAMRSILTAHAGGSPTFVVDYVTRMHDDLALDWPQPHISIPPHDFGCPGVSGRGVYRIEIDGSPAMRCELEMAENNDHDFGARVAGATFMVNAVPAVHAAAPGLLSVLDLPPIFGTGLVKPTPAPSPDSRRVGAFETPRVGQ